MALRPGERGSADDSTNHAINHTTTTTTTATTTTTNNDDTNTTTNNDDNPSKRQRLTSSRVKTLTSSPNINLRPEAQRKGKCSLQKGRGLPV